MNQHTFDLQGKTALITGGGKGIGLAISQQMVAAGARVIITGRTQETLQQTCDALGAKCSYIVHDVADFSSYDALLLGLKERTPTIDILINNAGINLKKWAVDTSVEEFQKIIDTNLTGAHSLTSRILEKYMIPQQSGSIIFIASMASLFGIPQVVAYASAKSGVIGMMRTLAVEVGSHHIRANAIAPGWIETDMSAKAMASDPKRKEKILSRTPLGAFGKVEDVAVACVFLASEASAFITGVTLPVDGGISIGF